MAAAVGSAARAAGGKARAAAGKARAEMDTARADVGKARVGEGEGRAEVVAGEAKAGVAVASLAVAAARISAAAKAGLLLALLAARHPFRMLSCVARAEEEGQAAEAAAAEGMAVERIPLAAGGARRLVSLSVRARAWMVLGRWRKVLGIQ